MRVVFMGSPAFALPSLQRLLESGYEIAGVFTQPDREAGRGRRSAAPAVKTYALSRGLAVFQPPKLRTGEAQAILADLAPDLVVVAAYGQILPKSVLELPRHGCVNVHASLLPRWRGAAPVAAAILAGDEVTGVSIMLMDEGLDTGPVLARRAVRIDDDDTTGTLTERLAALGAETLVETLPSYLEGALVPEPQDERLATYAPRLRKEDGRLDWSQPAVALWRRVRASNPWPVAFALYRDQPLRVLAARPVEERPQVPQGTVVALDGGRSAGVAAGEGVLEMLEVQRPGRRPLPIADFLRGERDFIGSRLD